ncbi:hypothetical protein [Mucilaginibacter sp.]|uniref:immunoglobulin domain-containing protein n=1 Tax=Mucilaginibacter sp. TaxID=1882438 RepID=UPI002627908C|nr:hypothetical protein [Mucilaginibacter sp.]MDB4925051.1 Gliding motility-associated C-terminal protein [Mucilaginibacter sp.]
MRAYLLFLLFVTLTYQGYSQSCATPIVVDFSKTADTAVTISGNRSGNCCSGSNCISFTVKVNPSTSLINFNTDQLCGSCFYTVNCGPLTPIGTPACISGLSTIQISFCKPGNNFIDYTITAIKGSSTSGNLKLRQGCTGTMSVSGLLPQSVTWTSIYPGATGAYNSYLSQTSGTSVNVTPAVGAPAYIDYKATGSLSTICSGTENDTVRVYTFSPLAVNITPANPLICPGTTTTLTATPTGGSAPYTYSWSTGETTPSITVGTAGTYTVSVNDQITNCGPVTKQATLSIITTVAPTASSATICSGNTATLTATAPGGPYQWYNAATGGNLLSTNSTYLTPVLSATATYYLQTTNSGCNSSRTAVTVTVNPNPPKPNISP